MPCFEDEMVIKPVSSSNKGLNQDEIGAGRLFHVCPPTVPVFFEVSNFFRKKVLRGTKFDFYT